MLEQNQHNIFGAFGQHNNRQHSFGDVIATSMPRSKKPGWVDWKKCPAREVIIMDLQPGGPLYLRENIPAEDIFPWYKQLPAFKDVVLDQFIDRLKDHRKAAEEDQLRAMQQQQYMEHDRRVYPRQPYNERGEPVFDMHPAKLLLREDIKNKLHLTTHQTPGKLYGSRLEYKVFKPEKFTERILQEIRRVKYFHYLKIKREAMRK
jgi:hypothetical protein